MLRHSRTGQMASINDSRADTNCPAVIDRMLIEKATKGNLEEVEYFLAAGANPDSTDAAGRSALHLAAMGGHVTVMQALRDAGANVYQRDYAGNNGVGLTADEYLTLWSRTGHCATPEHGLQAYASRPLDLWDHDTSKSLLSQYAEVFRASFALEAQAAFSEQPEVVNAAQEAARRLVEIRRTLKEYEATHAMAGHQGVRGEMKWEVPGWGAYDEHFQSRKGHRKWSSTVLASERARRAARDTTSVHPHVDVDSHQRVHPERGGFEERFCEFQQDRVGPRLAFLPNRGPSRELYSHRSRDVEGELHW